MIQLTLALKMTTAQVVETSVTVDNNSPIQDYIHPDDETQPTFKMTPGFKPFTVSQYCPNGEFACRLGKMMHFKVTGIVESPL